MAKTFSKEVQLGQKEVLTIVETFEQTQTYSIKQLKQWKQELKDKLDAVQLLIDEAKKLNIKEDEND